jgi:hypothetical protein
MSHAGVVEAEVTPAPAQSGARLKSKIGPEFLDSAERWGALLGVMGGGVGGFAAQCGVKCGFKGGECRGWVNI